MFNGRLVFLLGLSRQQEAGKLKIHTSQTPVAKVSGDLALHIDHVSNSCKLDAYTSVLQAYSRPVFSGQFSDMPESSCFGLLPSLSSPGVLLGCLCFSNTSQSIQSSQAHHLTPGLGTNNQG